MIYGIMAHVDSGKTTLTEQILFHMGVIRHAGRVDTRDTFLDHEQIERERGITVFSKQAIYQAGGTNYTLIDTPGHVDFIAETERAIDMIDAAVLVINGKEGVQAHTETLWNLLSYYEKPVFLFFNKMDGDSLSKETLLDQVRRVLSPHCFSFFDVYDKQNGIWTEDWKEELAATDDALLEAYLNQEIQDETWLTIQRREVLKRQFYPCFFGSALKDDGVTDFLEGFHLLAKDSQMISSVPSTDRTSADFTGKIYKIIHDPSGERITFLKVLSGTLRTKDPVYLTASSECFKINQIRVYSGARYQFAPVAVKGQIYGVTGLSKGLPGDYLGEVDHSMNHIAKKQPLLKASVLYPDTVSREIMFQYLKILESEEPFLKVTWMDASQELIVHVMGEIQLEVLQTLIEERFGIGVSFGPCRIQYKDTIADTVCGYGHFEPLRHYAEVHFRMEPALPGSGIETASELAEDLLDKNFQKLILTHVMEKEHTGVLTGAPVTDIKITLINGRAHLKHTEGGDFREAVYRAIRQGLRKADSVLLEPWYRFEIQISSEFFGKIYQNLLEMSAVGLDGSQDFLSTDDSTLLKGIIPLSEVQDYPREFLSLTKGKGRLLLEFDAYRPCHNAERIIETTAYDCDADIQNPCGSIFCSHGAGYYVPWNEVDEKRHIK